MNLRNRVPESALGVLCLQAVLLLPAGADELPLRPGETFQFGGLTGTLVKLDALPFVDSDYSRRFTFDSADNPKLKELRERYGLEEIVSPGKDEFHKQVLLLDWAHNRFPKFGWPSRQVQGGLEILEAIDEGHTFFCSQFADVFVSAAASLGWIARPLALRRPDSLGEGSTEHTSTEIWSNQYRKWAMFDPTYALYVEKDGLPLNAYELRQEWFYRDGADLVFVVGADRRRYRKADLPIVRRHFSGYGALSVIPKSFHVYAFIGFVPNTNLMDSGPDYANMFVVRDKLCDGTSWHRRAAPDDPAVDPYFPLNQAALSLHPSAGRLRVGLKTLTPNFETFLVRVDDGEWKPSSETFSWTVHEGTNRLEAVSRNKFGVRGPVSAAEVSAGSAERLERRAEETAPEPQQSRLPEIERVEIGPHGAVLVNGRPFFPLMSWLQSPRRYAKLRSLGFNTFCGGDAEKACDAAREVGGYVMVGFDDAFKGHAALLAYTQADEPDLGIEKGKPRTPAGEAVARYERLRARDRARPVFLNLTSYFREDNPQSSSPEKRAYYEEVVKACDIVSFDVYPIYGWNRDDKLTWVADGVSQLRGYAGADKPVFCCIETSKGSRWITYERQKEVRPEHTRAEVWMAIIRGATGIMYFTHAWRPSFTEFAPTEEMQRELKRLNAQITRLAPVILSGPARTRASISLAGDLPGEVMVREHEGSVYLFANNLDMQRRPGTASLTVEGLKAGTRIEVVDEDREIVAKEGHFVDEFAPLAVHLYRIRS